ncbi:cobalt ECF transporter T component CbiQ [Rhodobium gokarnense]|uniref:Cobalt/nickel transport system permease protein n=1 Tax=Rhodobium gokarnense TaxID=364296 RepID=A0ABT3HII8_9HYPH|nr:cobalt ECF transporter T component CbiQ [Rhodobium gokarnense]MCW2310215.1 cobalt/nickel transport system permease protein [Rhodobium gokarnense]
MGHVLKTPASSAVQTETLALPSAEAAGTTPIQGFDPRARILAVVAFALVVVVLSDLAALVVALCASLLAMGLANLPPAPTLRRMAMMDSFIIFMLMLLPFTMPGDPIVTIFGFPASWQGLIRAVEIALKANAIVLMLLSFVGTMDAITIGRALHRLKAPEPLVHLMMFTVRYIDVLVDEYQTLRTAMKARGFRPSNSRHTWKSFGYLVGMMLVRSLERSERILAAMKCRGFTGTIPLIDDLAWRRRDLGLGLVTFTLLTGLAAIEVLRAPL